MNTTARFTNGSSNVCSSAASNSSHRFIHVEQSYEVRSEERETIINALKIALVKYNQVEIAHRYGKATQPPKNGYYYYDAPENAIDGNLSTWNHTQCTETENWWQLELPKLSKVAKVVVYNRSGQTARLNGTKLYLGTQEYNGTLIESNDIETLTGSGEAQSFNYSPMKEGNYLLLKGDGTNCLHVAEVEVYGVLSDRPEFKTHESNYLIQGTTANGTEVATIEALDYQGDSLIYSIVGDVPFTIDNNGNITVNGTLGGKEYHFDVLVSDGVNSASTPITIQATTANAVEEALVSGSVLNVTEEELIQAARDEISSLKVGNSLLSQLYQNGSISYTSGNYHSQLINMYGDGSKTFPILYGNKNNVLAIAGQKEAGRFSVFASNPLYFFDRDENLEYESYMKRVFVWLIGEEPIDMNLTNTDKTVALSFVSDSSAVERWITKNYPNWSLKSCNDKATLESCYGDADLILLGRSGTDADAEAMRSVLPKMLTAAKSILYVHDNWGQNSLSQVVADLFEFSFPYGGNYWANDAALWTNIEEMQLALFNSFGYASIDTMLTHFQDGDYNFDWNQCTDGNGAFGSQYDKCADVAGLNSEFQKGATKVREMMNGLDGSKKNIFLSTGYRLQKLLVLIGDRFRQSVAYPMDKATTDDNEFMKAYYSDHAVYNYRFINPVQKDMGNFSRSDFSHITPYSKTVNLTSKKNFRSTGVYALPGQTMRVTRNDNSAVTTKVFINSLRSGATHEFESNGYKRPKFLQTPSFTIGSGESIELTSPYGGPVHIAFNINDLDVSFTFENIGEHAYWASPADDDSFTQKLDAGNFDWAEVVTSAFEVHSTLDKMRESVADAKWGTAEALAAATQRYMSNFPHVLAGFKGPGIDVVEEIHDFAATNSLTIENLDLVKHMNADQATCGYGCSGNPYDAYWAFSPIGHGDVHELGHGLEKSRFKFEGFELHAITNPYSYYTKSKYNETTGGEPDCQNLPFKEVFEKLQSSVAESNSTEYLKTNLWESSNWSHQVLVTIQAMMHTQKMGKLDNGWHLLARLHILEREITQAKVDWEANKASLGFDSYTLDEFNAMRNNDWLLVSFSFASGLDFRDYLSMMGIEYSQKASDQVASFNYTAVPKAFFVSTPNGYCKSDDTYGAFLSKSTLDVDGTTGFPY
ncbi:ImpA family metalloprotease [bacterium]|nr:ImpA family metalloprotease [bacterium]MBU1957941.1 ImpA family metalloprotease [bacterium]